MEKVNALLVVVAMLLAAPAVASSCPSGCEEYQGNCACDLQAHKAPEVNYASDEKPRKEQVREWESGEVKADMPQNLIAADSKLDQERAQADQEGKIAAGVPIN